MAQIAAYTLGIDLKLVSVKSSNSLTAPNSFPTVGSMGSDACGYVNIFLNLIIKKFFKITLTLY